MPNSLTTKYELMSQSIETIKTDMAEMKASNREGMSEIKNMLATHAAEEKEWWNETLNKKAGVWVEDVIRYGAYTIFGVIILAILGLIFVKTNHIITP